ncbi:MAG: Polyribonucleotide nucleotidyltransferase [candidate division TM6 bacterium GW2011_GWF2_28_16]|nr:MAG: Polyribonucleotide nucleotidyltransferase [candidate division TM6 bacterium GW2011_GWF2_28_16]
MQRTFKLESAGIEVEIGKYAKQADGSVWIKSGNNIVLSTAVATKNEADFMGFFPLTVEYREKTAAAGKIPGGFVKREGKLSDHEVLISRLIDRPIRPLFPSSYFNEVQLLSTVYSYDGEFPSDVLAIIGSSLSLLLAPNIPFMGPVGAVQACKINNSWKFNSSYKDLLTSNSHLVIAGTQDGICMVEGYADNLSEEELIDLIFKAHELIKEQIVWQLNIKKELNIIDEEIKTNLNWDLWKEKINNFYKPGFSQVLFVEDKKERDMAMAKLEKDLIENFKKELEEEQIAESILLYLFNSLLKEDLPNLIAKKNKRVDGRSLDEIRQISIDVANLPCAHGSALFTRGQTQALASVTLGTAQDAQKIEHLAGETIEKKFMLHYNFPPFATGEVKPMRGVGRREIGHGYLAEKSFTNVLPNSEKFPYTIRVISDVLESNGSSSMATVCATTMGLMDAGVPVRDLVSGVAMGLIKDSNNDFHVLTDILGMEDALGLMDFKVTGTKAGIMAIQMDIKAKSGLTKDVLKKALDHAKVGRLFILEKMSAVLPTPRKELSPYAPSVTTFKVPTDKIGAIIGPAGKMIKEIIAQTGSEIDIQDDGSVFVYAKTSVGAKKAQEWIRILAGELEVGSVFDGIIRRFTDFGVFVELVPGKDGLLHVSNIDKSLQHDFTSKYKTGDTLKVKVQNYDPDSGRISLIAPDLKK